MAVSFVGRFRRSGIPDTVGDLAGVLSVEMAGLFLTHGSEGEWLDEMSGAQREVFRHLVKSLQGGTC
ncbi:hypothetical protein E1281_10135 [Actinomadura sp. KC345]|uniref:hypothetical protein n=1 Tax=Actinomadura sp. KC345 TaxID=2530371 RepID=UPI0010519E6F|nr:hypothetical protein [Actinomadura sp. KC345]TDC55872.1 hypothetical protein E1281_10135 [Actinomadura sp. KC345]